MELNIANLEGIMPPMVTPFDNSEDIDGDAFCNEIDFLITKGINGLIVGGSTGEGPTINEEELEYLCHLTIKKVNDKVPVIAGIIPDSTREAVRKGEIAKRSGVQGLMVTPVHYFRPTAEGLYGFFQDIGKKVGLPIIIYNVVPINPVLPEVIRKLTEIDQLIGVKQSIGDGTASPGGQVEILAETKRGEGDFGSTGVK